MKELGVRAPLQPRKAFSNTPQLDADWPAPAQSMYRFLKHVVCTVVYEATGRVVALHSLSPDTALFLLGSSTKSSRNESPMQRTVNFAICHPQQGGCSMNLSSRLARVATAGGAFDPCSALTRACPEAVTCRTC